MARAYPAGPGGDGRGRSGAKTRQIEGDERKSVQGLDEIRSPAGPSMEGQNLRRASPRRLTEQGSVAVGPQGHFETVSELLNARGTTVENTVE